MQTIQVLLVIIIIMLYYIGAELNEIAKGVQRHWRG